jgi:hypothetical protein
MALFEMQQNGSLGGLKAGFNNMGNELINALRQPLAQSYRDYVLGNIAITFAEDLYLGASVFDAMYKAISVIENYP